MLKRIFFLVLFFISACVCFSSSVCQEVFWFIATQDDSCVKYWFDSYKTGDCMTSKKFQVSICRSGPKRLTVTDREITNDKDFLGPSKETSIPTLNFIELSETYDKGPLTVMFKSEELEIDPPDFIDQKNVKSKSLEALKKEYGVKLPTVSGKKTKLLYSYPQGLYINYEIVRAYYLPTVGQIVALTHSKIIGDEGDSLNGVLILSAK